MLAPRPSDALPPLMTGRFLRMLSIILEQLQAVQDADNRAEFAGLTLKTAALEYETDLLEKELEELCLIAFSVHSDLSLSMMIFRSLSHLERIGDYAFSVAHDLEKVAPRARSATLQDTLPLIGLLFRMVERLAYAFAERDLHAAQEVIEHDKQVDALYEQMHRASMTRLIERPTDTEVALTAGRIARHLERCGDLLVNVAERLIWLIESNSS